ncbi:MAG: protein kinase [Myxococcota bacterium]|nr:protein kinase [Myxococcota bacterium]
MANQDQIGRIIDGRYRLEEPFAKGGMSIVWRAQHLALEAPVAIKLGTLVQGDPREREGRIARFRREARSLAKIRSPHVVHVMDFGIDHQQPYLVMEYLAGKTLARRLRDEGRISPTELHYLLMEVADALTRAHEHQLVHRDLKPSNIVLVPWGDGLMTKLLDFGIVKRMGGHSNDTAQTGPNMLVGTPSFMSPEQIHSPSDVGPRSDLWSLAAIAFECLCGQRAFDGQTAMDVIEIILGGSPPVPSEVVPEYHVFDQWFRQALHADVDARFTSAFEMVTAFGEIANALSPDPPPFDETADTIPFQRITVSDDGRVARPASLETHSHAAQINTNLRPISTAFLGRKEEQTLLSSHIASHAQVITLTGPAGVGKSRLAHRVALDHLAAFQGGIWHVDLAPCTDTMSMVRAIAHNLSMILDRHDHYSKMERLLKLRGPTLLVLDNAEHLLDACADLVGRLSPATPKLKILITSRSRLKIEGEIVVPVEPLPQSVAVELFLNRALEASPDLVFDDAFRAIVHELVERLDRLSLAIELAAARLHTMSLAQLHARLSQRFHVLKSETRDHGARQRTMEAAIDWSWHLLKPIERWVLSQCSVFMGGFDEDAAKAVISTEALNEPPWIDEQLRRLVEESLLSVEHRGPYNRRYRVLHSVREYAAEKLATMNAIKRADGRSLTGPDAHREVVLRHAAHYARLGHGDVIDTLEISAGRTNAARLGADLANCLQATTQALACQRIDLAEKTALAACVHLALKGPFGQGAQLAADVLEVSNSASETVGRLMVCRALLMRISGDNGDALALAHRAIKFSRQHGYKHVESMALIEWASIRRKYSNDEEVSTAYARARDVARAGGDRLREAIALAYLGYAQQDNQAFEKSKINLLEAHEMLNDVGHRRLEGLVLGALGDLHFHEGRADDARRYYDVGLKLQRQVGDTRGEAGHQLGLGHVHALLGQLDEARTRFEAALRLGRAIGSRSTEVVALGHLGDAYYALGLVTQAQLFLEQAIALGDEFYPAPAAIFRGSLAWILAEANDFESARELITIAQNQVSGYTQNRALILCQKSRVEHRAGETTVARRAYLDARVLTDELGAGAGEKLRRMIHELSHRFDE